MISQELLGVAEAAKILRRAPRTVHHYVTTGRLSPVHKGPGITGSYVFDRADIEALAAELHREEDQRSQAPDPKAVA